MGVVRLAVIAGPTGAGKSALALTLAGDRLVTIVSADSRQVYRGFDIGTAKPTVHERGRVPHAMIDVAEPTQRMSAARWAEAATLAIRDVLSAGRRPLVVGGTGLYLRALFDPLFTEPPLDSAARTALERELSQRSTEELRAEVAQLDPSRAHLGRTQLLRSLEMVRLTGTSLSDWHAKAAREAQFSPSYLVAERQHLSERLTDRTDAMLSAGWIDEVRWLMEQVSADAPAWNATGYDTVRQVVQGGLGVTLARQQVIIATRQYAKRQRTWFRHQLDPATVTRLDLDADGAIERAHQWWCAQESL